MAQATRVQKQCHPVPSVDIEKKLPQFLNFFLFVAILAVRNKYICRNFKMTHRTHTKL